jgi:hypothetical protein
MLPVLPRENGTPQLWQETAALGFQSDHVGSDHASTSCFCRLKRAFKEHNFLAQLFALSLAWIAAAPWATGR